MDLNVRALRNVQAAQLEAPTEPDKRKEAARKGGPAWQSLTRFLNEREATKRGSQARVCSALEKFAAEQ